MNPDFAIVLNYQLKDSAINATIADKLVKIARDIGARAVSGSEALANACKKYTIFLANEKDGEDLTAENVIDTMVENCKNGKQTIINVSADENGKFSDATQKLLTTINNWMHMFGHTFNEGQPSELTVDQDGFVLENHHADYQKYVFLKSPLPEKIVVTGLKQEPNRVEWIEKRVALDFTFKDGKLTINLTKPDDEFPWQVLRIQAHRPEDDIKETKF